MSAKTQWIQQTSERHRKWLTGQGEGARADFSNQDLCNADFCNTNLDEAEFSGARLVGARFVKARLAGVDFFGGGGSNTLRNNTIEQNGWGGTETGGIRGLTSDNTIELNIFRDNVGSGVLVVVADPAFPTAGAPGLRNRLSRNHFSGNGSNAIDLQTTLDLIAPGDGITANDGTLLGDSSVPNVCGTDPDHGNEGLDAPIIDQATFGSPTSVVGRACPSTEVEIYRAVADADSSDTLGGDDFGEGTFYLGATNDNIEQIRFELNVDRIVRSNRAGRQR